MIFFDDFDREFGSLQNNRTISVDQAKDIAKRIIPGITDEQLQFIEMQLLQSRLDYPRSEQLLGQMRGKSIELRISRVRRGC